MGESRSSNSFSGGLAQLATQKVATRTPPKPASARPTSQAKLLIHRCLICPRLLACCGRSYRRSNKARACAIKSASCGHTATVVPTSRSGCTAWYSASGLPQIDKLPFLVRTRVPATRNPRASFPQSPGDVVPHRDVVSHTESQSVLSEVNNQMRDCVSRKPYRCSRAQRLV